MAIADASTATGAEGCRCGRRIIRARTAHFLAALRRLTRVHVRSVEQPVNLDDGDDIYNWPWVYAVQVGEWGLTPNQGRILRDYLLRGGFFMADDFHGREESKFLSQRMKQVFPDRPMVDIPDNDPIFHTVYDLDDRTRFPEQRTWQPAIRRWPCGAVDGNLRRQGTGDGGDFVQFGHRRFVGMGG